MSVLISEDKTWLASKWVSVKLFEDFLNVSQGESEVVKKIRFLLDLRLDTLNLIKIGEEGTKEFIQSVPKILEFNLRMKGSDMSNPDFFGIYFNKLLDLEKMLESDHYSSVERIMLNIEGLLLLLKTKLSKENLKQIEHYLSFKEIKLAIETMCESIYDDEIILESDLASRINALCEDLNIDRVYWMDID